MPDDIDHSEEVSQLDDVLRRLSAADPVAHSPYQHRDLDAMTSRILGHRVERTDNVWRRFQLRVGLAVSATAVATAGAVVALGSLGTTVPALSFAAPQATSQMKSAGAITMMGVSPLSAVLRISGNHVLPNVAPVTKVEAPSNSARAVGMIGALLGIRPISITHPTPSTWNVSGTGRATIVYRLEGSVATWTAVLPTVHRTSTHLTDQQIVNVATRVASAVAPAATITSTVSWASDPRLSPRLQPPLDFRQVFIRYSLDGFPTDLRAGFIFDGSGQLVWATGPDAIFASAHPYPLQSVDRAVRSLNQAVSSSPAPVAVRVPIVRLELRTQLLSDGSRWLIPVYVFVTSHATTTRSWYEVAISPDLVKSSGPTGGVVATVPLR